MKTGTALLAGAQAKAHESPAPRMGQVGVPLQKPSHLFVDNVRFWSMFAVVALHSAQIIALIVHQRPELVIAVTTPIKFGTIAFFLASGFLAGRGVETAHPWIYLRRRIARILPPWCCWIAAMIAALFARDLLHHRVALQSHALLTAAVDAFNHSFFDTPFWFVPNLLLCLAILLLFRKMHGSLLFGAALLGCSLFYAVNIYAMWIPSRHTEALLGFVFYLWLGSYASREHAKFDRWISQISLVWFLALASILGLSAYAEARFLLHRAAEDPMNSLRLSNQAFSVAAVLLIYKFQRATWPRFVRVREDTYGIYLSHPLVLLLLWPLLNTHLMAVSVRHLAGGGLSAGVIWICLILAVYGLSLTVTKALVGFAPLRFLIGLETTRDPLYPKDRKLVPAAGLAGEELRRMPGSA